MIRRINTLKNVGRFIHPYKVCPDVGPGSH
jgi:hypothetical protein